MARLSIKVTANAQSNALLGWLGKELKLSVTAVPEKGKANLAVQKLLAGQLGVASSQIVIVSGKSSSRKTLEIADLSQAALHAQLHKLLK